MRCHRYQKWISDRLDGELSQRREQRLESHLQACPSCRHYESQLKRIQEDTKKVEREEVSQEYLRDFSVRLRSKLVAVSPPKKKRMMLIPGFQWGVAALSVAVIAGLAALFFFPGVFSRTSTERFVFSIDDAVQEIRSDIGEDQELEELFNMMILASIENSLQDSNWNELPGFDEKLYDQVIVSEGDLQQVEQENSFDLRI